MYELEEHLPRVADLIDDDAPGHAARLRTCGLGRGQIVYRLDLETRRVELDDVSFTRLAGDRSSPTSASSPPSGTAA